MRRTLIALLLLLALGAQAADAAPRITRDAQRDVMLTIYNGNLGLVKDVREARFAAGLGEVQFMDVAALIDPTTVHLRSLTDPAGLKILEQNYEYDLLTSQKLLEKYVGRTVRLYQGDGTFHDATLLSTQGPVFEIGGQIHLGYTGRLVLPALPENLVAKPTLVWLTQSRSAAPQRVEASYLTGGITWKADYVLVLDATDRKSDLTGWVTIDNKSGATYRNAALKLVAGDVNRAGDGRREGRVMEMAARAASVADATREFKSEGFFEYHLYTLDGRTTVKDQQTKQLSLMAASDVPVTKRLIYWGAQDYYRNSYGVPISNQKVGVYLELENRKEHRLGLPLPKGKIRVYKADASGSEQFVGEDWIDHTPKDERVKIKMGNAFDVVGERKQTDFRKLAAHLWEVEWEISLRNHKQEAQTVTVIEPIPGDWQVLSSTHRYEKIEAHTLRYEIPVPKDGAAKLVYRVRIRL
ncbi:MAG: DUF4139 domain-containing protein [Candidatus Rokubacteria bacterium RIFCSPLOWO2_12_FULL_71_22]|nr:MAG: DUF4139 domain-containing protein [Candidatus Rokubacteria bacterium RIFCSPLOWO2_12_FULL_71_22]